MFSVGDRVRVVSGVEDNEVGPEEIGQTGVVVNVEEPDVIFPIAVVPDHEWRDETDLNAVKAEAEKSGDPIESALWVYYDPSHLELVN